MKKRYLAWIILASFISANIAIFLQIPYSEDYNVPFKDKHLKIGASDIMIITPENSTYIAPMSGYYLSTFGFENDPNNTDPINWNDMSLGACDARIVAEKANHYKVLELNDQSGIDSANIIQDFEPAQLNGTIELWILNTHAVNDVYIVLRDSSNNWCVDVRLHSGIVDMRNGSSQWINCGPYIINIWYHVKIKFDCISNTYQGYLNGVLKADGASFTDNDDGGGLTRLHLTTFGGFSGYSGYYDAIGYSWDPNYNIGDNLDEGLLLSFENTTTLDWIGFSLDGSANKTILGNTTIPIPLDGPHNIQVFGNNSIGAIFHSDIRYFTVDTTPPQLSITYPTTEAEFSNPPSFILSITEENIASTWYTLNGGPNIPFTGTSGVIDSTAWNALPNGPITIRFYIRDIVDSEDFDEVIVIKTTSQEIPPVIPGYNILILIGISCVIIGVSAKRKLKF